MLLNADPPDHARQRKLVNKAFVPPKVKSIEPRIREVAHELVDTFAPRGEVELVQEYAVLLPLTIIAECLGVAGGDLPMFQRWSDDFVAAIGNHEMTRDQLRSQVLSQHEFFVYFAERIAERRAEPRTTSSPTWSMPPSTANRCPTTRSCGCSTSSSWPATRRPPSCWPRRCGCCSSGPSSRPGCAPTRA